MPQPLPLLTIAGSDSGGAAGLQADLKTWAALGVYGLSAITAVTAQNSERVAAVNTLPPDFVAAQIDAVLSDYGAVAIKTGFLGQVEIVEVVAERLTYWRNVDIGRGGSQTRPYIIIDPVLVNHRGEAMFPPAVAAAYRALLFPLADLVTPNRAEAGLLRMWDEAQGGGEAGEQGGVELLQSQDSPSLGERNRPANASPLLPRPSAPLPSSGATRILLKGIQRGDEMVDVYWDGQQSIELPQPRIDTINTHGSGDTLSAAICAYVALGHAWPDAIGRAQAFTHAAIGRGAAWRLGAGHGPVGVTSDE